MINKYYVFSRTVLNSSTILSNQNYNIRDHFAVKRKGATLEKYLVGMVCVLHSTVELDLNLDHLEIVW